MALTEFIQQYLLLNKTVSIKGWGTLQMISVSAELDFSNRLLYAPSVTFKFTSNETDDSPFVNWLANQMQATVEMAGQKRNLFVINFKQSIESIKKIKWVNWGVFEQTKDGQVVFIPDAAAKTLLHAVIAERIIRKGAEHSVRVGEDERTRAEMEELLHLDVKKKKPLWLLNALVLLTIGIILASYFASSYNILWNQHTNYQQLQIKDPPVLYKKH